MPNAYWEDPLQIEVTRRRGIAADAVRADADKIADTWVKALHGQRGLQASESELIGRCEKRALQVASKCGLAAHVAAEVLRAQVNARLGELGLPSDVWLPE